MSNLRIANRYAEALMETAEELKVVDDVSRELKHIQQIIKDSHDFLLFLKSPVIKKEKKQQVLEATFGSHVQPIVMQFLLLLTEKGREDILSSVVEAFFKLLDEKLGYVNVQIISATEFSKQQTEQIIKQFEAYSNKKVRLDVKINPVLIGGFVARIGDTMFDGSVKRQLELLRQQFTEEIFL